MNLRFGLLWPFRNPSFNRVSWTELYRTHLDLFAESSPIRYAEQAQTPILIMHGDADPRVDPRQSEILYRYLVSQENPPPTRLIFYKDEGHGNRRAASRYDYSLRMMRWMNHYLKGPGGNPPPVQIDYDLGIHDN